MTVIISCCTLSLAVRKQTKEQQNYTYAILWPYDDFSFTMILYKTSQEIEVLTLLAG